MTIPFETSSLLSVPHGFFGREGGQSQGEFAALNMSASTGDDPATVDLNRQTALAALGKTTSPLRVLKQVHSNRVHVLTDLYDDRVHEADATVTNLPGVVLGTLTADCTPILLADAKAGVIGATHAGWRGAADGIVKNTIAEMINLGATLDGMVAVIGPTISQGNYQVNSSFLEDFLKVHARGDRFFVPDTEGRFRFDLPGFVADQLSEAGVMAADLGLCTYADPQRYFSHRYTTHNGGRTGRQIALIALP